MTLPNPYQNETNYRDDSPRAKPRSSALAYFSIVFAGLIGIAMLASQQSFARMFIEFEIELPLVTSIACWRGLPILILTFSIVLFLIGMQPNFHSIANRVSGLVIGSSTIILLIYIWGVFSPLMNLITGLSR